MSKQKKLAFFIVVVFLVLNFFLWSAIFGQKGHILKVAFLDVGQGDAIFIEGPNGNQVLIDGGKGKAVLRELGKVMPFYDKSIDLVIATHSDADHIGGIPEVMDRYRVSNFMDSGAKSDSSYQEAIRQNIIAKEANYYKAKRGIVIDLGKGVSLEILFPDRQLTDVESNLSSIVALLSYGEMDFLLTGDSPKSVEKYLAFLDGKKIKSEVLKVGHHGSKTSSENSFVAAVRPIYAIISAGKNNSYGHPHPDVIKTLEEMNAEILKTYESGTIIFKTDGVELTVKK